MLKEHKPLTKNERIRLDRKWLKKKPKTGCFVYVIAERMDGPPVYVGQTRQPLDDRFRWHLKDAVRRERAQLPLSPIQRWILDMLNDGKMPVIRMQDENAKWDITEAVWIDRLTHRGHNLLNVEGRVP